MGEESGTINSPLLTIKIQRGNMESRRLIKFTSADNLQSKLIKKAQWANMALLHRWEGNPMKKTYIILAQA